MSGIVADKTQKGKSSGFSGQDARFRRFIANGTFTVPKGCTFIIMECIGAGGGGGSGSGNNGTGSGGGGGAAMARGIFNASSLGKTLTLVVGVGGAGGAGTSTSDGNNGSAGTDTTVADGSKVVLSAFGGGGGGYGKTPLTLLLVGVAAEEVLENVGGLVQQMLLEVLTLFLRLKGWATVSVLVEVVR